MGIKKKALIPTPTSEDEVVASESSPIEKPKTTRKPVEWTPARREQWEKAKAKRQENILKKEQDMAKTILEGNDKGISSAKARRHFIAGGSRQRADALKKQTEPIQEDESDSSSTSDYEVVVKRKTKVSKTKSPKIETTTPIPKMPTTPIPMHFIWT